MKKVLISGGSGLVGTRLTQMLLREGYSVAHLSRSADKHPADPVRVYQWDINKQTIDPAAIAMADIIVHLAGAGIADKRWSDSRKKEIIDSRVKSTQLLQDELLRTENQVTTFISASAIGYYGSRGAQILSEATLPGDDGFLSITTQKWERAVQQLNSKLPAVRTAILRTGIVLSENGGALPKTALPVKFRVGAYFGSGQMYYSWIHIDDLCRMYIHAITNTNIKGIYNAVAPNPVKNKDFIRAIAKATDHKALLLPTPKPMLRLALGEMADVLLQSANVSAEKIIETGFKFEYPTINTALENIY